VVFDERIRPVSHIAVEGRAAITASNGYAFQDASAEALRRLEPEANTTLS
jgi:hypothetical protein